METMLMQNFKGLTKSVGIFDRGQLPNFGGYQYFSSTNVLFIHAISCNS